MPPVLPETSHGKPFAQPDTEAQHRSSQGCTGQGICYNFRSFSTALFGWGWMGAVVEQISA